MPDLASTHLRVAIVSRSVRQRDCLKEILEINGLMVISDDRLQQHLPQGLNEDLADVILVNLDDSDDPALDVLIDQTSLPILFNDSSSIRKQATPGGRAWGRRLASKLVELSEGVLDNTGSQDQDEENAYNATNATGSSLHLVMNHPEMDEDSDSGETLEECERSMLADSGITDLEMDLDLDLELDIETGFDPGQPFDRGLEREITEEFELDPVYPAENFLSVNEISAAYRSEITQELLTEKAAATSALKKDARIVFVLGASIGGPQAVKSFLSLLPAKIEAGFILAQHIGAGFVGLLSEQLGRITPLEVMIPNEGMHLKNGQLIVAPVEEEISFDPRGGIHLNHIQQRSIYSPSIDHVMTEVARHYGSNTHAVVFSGMGNDGTAGCKAVAAQGGTVWAQTANSCVISSMADSVRSAGLVSESGTPEQLARLVKQFLQNEVSA